MVKAKVKDPDAAELVQDAALGVVRTAECLGNEAVEDWEVDTLLNWTSALDFDK